MTGRAASSVTTVYVRPDGPYIVTGDFVLQARGAPRDDASVVLCRCGHSSNQPYCDGTHRRIGFADAGVLATIATPNAPAGVDRPVITPTPNGPLKCEGVLTVSGAGGRTHTSQDIRLCRCGGSGTKPFCDGTHKRRGFVG